MSAERDRRVGHNEALFRHVNETVEQLNRTIDHISDDFSIVCECGKLECTDQIHVSRDVYESTRGNPLHFLVKPGHELPEFEHVVESGDGYVVVEKDPAAAQAVARATDLRS